MALFYDPVIFEVKAKATEAIATFGKVNAELAKMEKNGLLAGGALGKIERAARLTRTAFLGLAGTATIVGVHSLEVFGKVQASQALLKTAVENTGVAFSDFSPYLDEANKKMAALGFNMIDTSDALAKMAAASGSPKLALESLGAAADLARFKHIGLADAGKMVARASVGMARGLADLGIALGKTLPKGATFQQVMAKIEEVAGGAAKAYGETLPGKLDKFRAQLEELEYNLGEKLLPKANQFLDWVNNSGIPGFEHFTSVLSKHKTAITQVGAALGGLWLGGKIAAGISLVAKAVEGLGAAIAALGGASMILARLNPYLGLIALAGSAAFATYQAFGGRKPAATMKSFSEPMSISGATNRYAAAAASNIQGRGVARVSPTGATVNVTQNVTVYAKDANAMTVELARAARTGTTLGVGQMDSQIKAAFNKIPAAKMAKLEKLAGMP